ncbi:polyribonucleotide nucleotidyltransferase [candidate division KSB1 bacterium]|nr:polyribonucleotide nucleotidyltransferase [candidate division KSB1 bacterium]
MIFKKEMNLGGKNLSIETGKLAKQANGAVLVKYEDTVILATAVASKKPLENIDFFPLSVEYREKAYAAGKIPGGYFKREGRPSENEILTARIIDRPIRPLFPDNFRNEIQLIVFVLSSDKENDPDVLGLIGASAALSISDIPFQGPVAAVRIGKIGGEFIVNPTYLELESSDIELVIAGTEESIVMVEGESREISEDTMVQALEFGHNQIKAIIKLQQDLIAECAKPKRTIEIPTPDESLISQVHDLAASRLEQIVNIQEKAERSQALADLVDELKTKLEEQYPESDSVIVHELEDIEKKLVRNMILEENRRLDGRKADEIRPISCEIGLLPRTHGSALFTRGQTQALAVTTLGTKIDEQKMDALEGEFFKSYMLHYNFPPFCVGEVSPIRGTSRREIGHGNLAERALKSIVPSDTIFPYTIRIVSDVLESNGSSSMATVCAGSLSLMDAGVPVKDAVAGIAMGLVKEGDRVAVLSDILGDEDHLGDMDFKVAGTLKGITAFQMDIKISGISLEIIRQALAQAKQGRQHILEIMNQTISKPKAELSSYAPRIISMKVDNEFIGMIIGPGGRNIRDIVERTGAAIDINDDGIVTIASVEPEKGMMAKNLIEDIIRQPEVGAVYTGKVKRIVTFGAFVEIMPGKEGLLHISQIDHQRVNRVEDVLKLGDEVQVKLLKIDDQGRLDLSRKVLLERSSSDSADQSRHERR